MLLKGAILRHSENPTVMLNNLCARAVGLELGMAEFILSIIEQYVCKIALQLFPAIPGTASYNIRNSLYDSSDMSKIHMLYEQCEFK